MDGEHLQADVLIIGAGPGGSTAASLLARAGRDVLLLDRAEFPRDKTCGDGLTPRAVAVLGRLGLLENLRGAGYQTITGARVVAPTGEVLDIPFDRFAQPLGLPELGLVVPRFELDDRLRRHALESGTRFCSGVHVTHPVYDSGRVVGVKGTRDGRPFEARAALTMLATGANIGLLRTFGVIERMPPGVNAVRAYYTGVESLETQFEFYFEQDIAPGYAWVFPLASGRANVGIGYFGRDAKNRPPDVKKMLEDFVERYPRFRHARLEGPIKGFPLRTDFPSHAPIGPGFMILGESLGLVNPATGEGIDFAMESAELAAQAANHALNSGDTSRAGLEPYARLLSRQYGRLFRGLTIVKRLAMGPHAISVLVHKARKKPRLAQVMAGVTLAALPPWTAFTPAVWWDILT